MDITLCEGTQCAQKHRCARFTLHHLAGEYQSWYLEPPLSLVGWCSEFIEVETTKRKKRILNGKQR